MKSWAPGRKRFRSEGKGLIASLAVTTYVCEACGLWQGSTKPGMCKCSSMAFLKFDSRAEARRWAELLLMLKSGLISNLHRQVRFPLMALGMVTGMVTGREVLVGYYIADFTYIENGARVVEDCKGDAITDLAKWKLRHFHAQYGFEVKLVKQA